MGNILFTGRNEQIKTKPEPRIDGDGNMWLQVVAHAELTAKTPYKIIFNEYGRVSAALTGDAGLYMIGVPKKTVAAGAVGELQVHGYVENMITASLSVAVGHGLYIDAGAVADSGADYSGAKGEFAVCTEESTTSTSQHVFLTGNIIHGTQLSIGKYVRSRIVAKTTNYTCTLADSGTIFTTTGAAGAVTFTLPAVATAAGVEYTFINTVGQNMVISDGSVDTIVTFNDAAADTLTFSSAGELIGAAVKVVCDGAKWLSFKYSANTQTVGT